jgi:hypothetical protein
MNPMFTRVASTRRAADMNLQAQGGSGKLSGSNAFIAGFSARAVASVTLLPLTVVKTRFEAGERYKYYNEAFQAFIS